MCVSTVDQLLAYSGTSPKDAPGTRGLQKGALGPLSKSSPSQTQEVRQSQVRSAVCGSTLVSFSFYLTHHLDINFLGFNFLF